MKRENILVWLPSPIGDAILSTPALRAIREYFSDANITFIARPVVRDVLSPSPFNNDWIIPEKNCPLCIAKTLKSKNFTHAILFKNSIGSAAAVFFAGIPIRTGYAREFRSIFLTEKLHPKKISLFRYKPLSMVDYYLAITSWLGADSTKTYLALATEPDSFRSLYEKIPQFKNCDRPVIILVPGGAFGPSKCWKCENFAKTADLLAEKYNAQIAVSVAPEPKERAIAENICKSAKTRIINLTEKNISLQELKALISICDLLICNDTGPRHIAIALNRKLITLFGPNNPKWTDTGYENEIKIMPNAACAPCDKAVCRMKTHICMDSITPEMVCQAGHKLLQERS